MHKASATSGRNGKYIDVSVGSGEKIVHLTTKLNTHWMFHPVHPVLFGKKEHLAKEGGGAVFFDEHKKRTCWATRPIWLSTTPVLVFISLATEGGGKEEEGAEKRSQTKKTQLIVNWRTAWSSCVHLERCDEKQLAVFRQPFPPSRISDSCIKTLGIVLARDQYDAVYEGGLAKTSVLFRDDAASWLCSKAKLPLRVEYKQNTHKKPPPEINQNIMGKLNLWSVRSTLS